MSAYALFQTNLGPKADNAAPQTGTAQPAPDTHAAPAASSGGGTQSMLTSLLPFILLAVMVPILLSSRKNDKRDQAARSGMKKGDRVTSDSGLIGELVELGEKTSKVKLAPGITVEMMTNKILPQAVTAPAKDDKLKDLKEAKSDAKSAPAAALVVPASAEKK